MSFNRLDGIGYWSASDRNPSLPGRDERVTNGRLPNWLYRKTGPNRYVVGFYDPMGVWQPDQECETKDKAARRVHYLNGGN